MIDIFCVECGVRTFSFTPRPLVRATTQAKFLHHLLKLPLQFHQCELYFVWCIRLYFTYHVESHTNALLAMGVFVGLASLLLIYSLLVTVAKA